MKQSWGTGNSVKHCDTPLMALMQMRVPQSLLHFGGFKKLHGKRIYTWQIHFNLDWICRITKSFTFPFCWGRGWGFWSGLRWWAEYPVSLKRNSTPFPDVFYSYMHFITTALSQQCLLFELMNPTMEGMVESHDYLRRENKRFKMIFNPSYSCGTPPYCRMMRNCHQGAYFCKDDDLH